MSTVSKAIDLLSWFSAERAEIGLAEFQRLTGRDKATTYRYLTALETSALLEQDPITRAYRMGPAVLRLAHIREVTVPRRAGVRMVLPALAEATGETAHASILQGSTLITLADHSSGKHSARVVLDNAVLPLHATASGLAVLAFTESAVRNKHLKNLVRYTDFTPTTRKELEAAFAVVYDTGFGISDQGFEEGVYGISAPLFDSSNQVAGAVAVASVSARVTDDLISVIKRELVDAARKITRSWGGNVPEQLDAVWSNTLDSLSNESSAIGRLVRKQI